MASNRWVMLALLGVCAAGCVTTGAYGRYGNSKTIQVSTYAASRSDAILNTTRDAERYCRERGGGLVRVVREETVYQGQLDEQISASAQALGRVASAMGNTQAGQAGAAMGSPTDYKTTLEFVCQ